jgi:hypothetical protein
MPIPVWVLLGFAAWTLLILFTTVGVYRWSHDSQFLRQAVERNLRHYQRVERAIFAHIYRQDMR